MNKKFLSAIMCGALLTASTSVFVSCEDYGDDIANLQTQIDQNATTAASELAAKVAALESQLSTLKAAQDGMKEQLAAAKAEAATAANNAMLAAQAAQAAADKAQGGADDAKAAAAAAQATADAAAKNLADAVARVANLEGKIELLQGTITELSASNKELNTKLADLQLAFNSLSATVGTNSKEIEAVKADLAAKVADLTAQITTVSATIGGQIDAINAELNSIKANYATKGELSEVAASLAAVSTKLEGQIATNTAYVAEMEEVIAGLEAKDAAAAALIAANNEATLAEIAKINESLAAQKAAVDAEFENVKAQIADIEETVAQLAQLATANYEDIATVRQALEEKTTEIFDLISQLTVADRGILEQIEIIFESLADVTTTANDNADLITQLIGADKGFSAAIETILVNLDALNTSAADAADQIAQLIGADKGFADQIEALLVDYTQNKEEVADLISQLIGADRGFAAQIEELLVDYTQNKEEVADLISQLVGADRGMAAQIEQLLINADSINGVTSDLAAQIAQLVAQDDKFKNKIQSMVDEDTKLNDAIKELNHAIMALKDMNGALAAKVEAILAETKVLGGDLAAAKDDIAALKTASDKAAADIVKLFGLLTDKDVEIGQINDAIEELQNLVGDNTAALEGLAADIKAIKEWKSDFMPKYAETIQGIYDDIFDLTAKNVALTKKYDEAVANLQGQIDAIINGLHSVAFVPLYNILNYDIPVYYINTFVKNNKGEVVEGTNLYPTSTVKFRVEPAGYAAKLAAAFEENKDILKLESTDRVVNNVATTRATAAFEMVEIKKAVADGDFLVLSVAAVDNLDGASKHIRPTTLVVSNDALSKTSDYFKVLVAYENATAVNNEVVYAEGDVPSHVEITKNEVNALNKSSIVNVNLYHNVFTPFDIVKAATELSNKNASYLLPYDGTSIESDLQVVEVNDEAMPANGYKDNFFTVTKDGKISVNSKNGLPVPGNLTKTIKVKVVDKAYQLNDAGEDYVVYNYTFTIVENRCELDLQNFNYAMEWPKTTAAEQEITVDLIKNQHAAKLDEYKVSAQEVFDALYSAIGAGMVKEQNNVIVTLTAVTKDGKKHIYVSSKIANLAIQNYFNTNILLDDLFTFELDEVETTLTLGVNVALTTPADGLDFFFEKILMYWLGEGNNTLQVNYSLAEVTNGTKYVYEVEMPKVYRSITDHTVSMAWSLDKKTNKDGEETTGFEGIAFDGNTLKVTAPIFAVYPSGKVAMKASDLTFTAEAYYGATNFGKHYNQLFNVVYPIKNGQFENEISDMNFYYEDLKAGLPFEVVKGINLTDIDGHVWIKEGKIHDEVKTEWGIKNLEYSISSVESAGQILTAEELFTLVDSDSDGVEDILTINKQANITKDVYVTIKVSVDYTFATGIWDEYVVVIKPGKKPVGA